MPVLCDARVSASILLGVSLAAGVPRAAVADGSRAIDPWSRAVLPADRALSGGVVRLRAAGSQMIRVPQSVFLMGSTELEVMEAGAACGPLRIGLTGENTVNSCSEVWFATELPRHQVTVSSFWLDRTEVTVAEYERCVALHHCRPVPFAEGARRFRQPFLPISLVTWEDAARLCALRGGRLPTEAEWERAARGLRRSTYPWGSRFHHHVANYGRVGWDTTDDRDGYAELAPVGSFPAGRTAEGFLDLAGNVSEWVADRFGPYEPGPADNPRGPQGALAGGTSDRVVRGGDFRSAPPVLRAAARQQASATLRAPTVGFRCARPAVPSGMAGQGRK